MSRESTAGRCLARYPEFPWVWPATAAIAEQVKGRSRLEETKADELEPFKYDIESEKGWVGPGGSAKEATVKTAARFAIHRGRLHEAGSRRDSRIALARARRRVGLR